MHEPTGHFQNTLGHGDVLCGHLLFQLELSVTVSSLELIVRPLV